MKTNLRKLGLTCQTKLICKERRSVRNRCQSLSLSLSFKQNFWPSCLLHWSRTWCMMSVCIRISTAEGWKIERTSWIGGATVATAAVAIIRAEWVFGRCRMRDCSLNGRNRQHSTDDSLLLLRPLLLLLQQLLLLLMMQFSGWNLLEIATRRTTGWQVWCWTRQLIWWTASGQKLRHSLFVAQIIVLMLNTWRGWGAEQLRGCSLALERSMWDSTFRGRARSDLFGWSRRSKCSCTELALKHWVCCEPWLFCLRFAVAFGQFVGATLRKIEIKTMQLNDRERMNTCRRTHLRSSRFQAKRDKVE